MIIIPKEEPKQCKCGSNWVNTTNKDNPFCFHCGKPLTQEPKQETLEEFIKSQPYYGYCTTEYKEGIEVGAKWQEKRMYSEEDMFTFSQWISHEDWVYLPSKDYWVNEEQEELEQKLSSKEILNLWFEQFKKK
jgi:hypothetical protein